LAKAPQQIASKRQRKSQLVRIGDREIETRGLAGGFWTDLYHRSMTVYWPVFFGSAAAIFVILNAVFAFVYSLGDEPVANVAGDRALGLFYFSIETLATVGYGDMHPQTDYGHFVATVEIFTGMCFLAVMTGLIFARFSRPRARFIFAEHPVVAVHQGQPTLMIRVANARNNTISQATARLWLFRVEKTVEGYELRRYYELMLDRREHPMFMLTWSIFHTIDETSPLYRMTANDLAAADATLTLNVGGVDDSSAQRLYARRLYSHRDIRWNHRYKDITSVSADGRLLIDYSLFHEVVPEEA
jgi:inward rectifier potassium channel